MTAALARLIAERGDVLDALGNGADDAEGAWPPGLTVPQAVARLRGERAAVVAWLRACEDESCVFADDIASQFATDIERGEHRRGEKE
jgi:hypothetical protein